MHYMTIIYFYSLKYFYVSVSFTRNLIMRTKEEQEKGCPRASEGVSQERGESLRRGVPRKGEQHHKGMAQKGGEPQKGTSSQSTRPERLYIADT